ncbi:MAG: hypothetical protein LBJ82_06180 [Deltaproteobacteria bacterium]|jgi:hypothetical protein|nr:hypothetical protein [Deltaproteobacteria bacterium]
MEFSMQPRAKNTLRALHLAGLILCLICLTIRPGSAAAEEPLDAVILAQQAIDSKNPDLFHQAVDLQAILARGLDKAMRVLSKRITDHDSMDPLLSLLLSQLDEGSPQAREFLKTFLLSEIRTFINTGISRGVFAGTSKEDPDFSPLFQRVSPERKELLPGKVLSRKGGRATISATLLDQGAGSFPLRLSVENAEGRWRITEILNAPELLEQALRHGR